jgi:hypothetical protein
MLAVGHEICSSLTAGDSEADISEHITVNGTSNSAIGLKIVLAAGTDLCPNAGQ